MGSLRARAGVLLRFIVAAATFLPCPSLAQGSLKIVVIEGEGAVNILQQKTAVAPVVEVRDRNNQPVAGAVVRFAITRGRAAFNGARALTVTTNQIGRAVAAGFAPTGAGSVQISAAAAFQGQSVAITIAQTNVLTAAAGAQATAAAAGGTGGTTAGGTAAGAGAGGAGGGGSATTVGIVAGAAAGGAIAVKEAVGSSAPVVTAYAGPYSGPLTFTGSSNGLPFCGFTTNVVGTLTIHLTIAGDGSVSGAADIHRNSTLGQSTCDGASAGELRLDRLQVNGSATSVVFEGQQTFSSTGATLTVTFQGALNGTVIAGTLDEAWSNRSGNFLTAGSASFPVALNQQ